MLVWTEFKLRICSLVEKHYKKRIYVAKHHNISCQIMPVFFLLQTNNQPNNYCFHKSQTDGWKQEKLCLVLKKKTKLSLQVNQNDFRFHL